MLAPPPLPRNLDASLRDLASTSAQTRASAIVDLARHAAESDATRTRAVPLLEKALRGDASSVARSAAAVALADLHAGEALPALLLAIEDADVHVRQMAINALGEIGDARATSRIARALDDERAEVRYQAIIAYAKLATEPSDVNTALLRALDDADPAVRYIALRIAEERAEHAQTTDRDARLDSRLASRARALLAPSAGTKGKDDHAALAAAIVLAKFGAGADRDEARAMLRRVIHGDRVGGSLPEKEDEREAVELAGQLEIREAIPDLERRAWGLRSFVRDTCAWHAKIALARMGHARAVAEILRDLDATHAETRAAAIVAVGRARLAQASAKLTALGPHDADPELVAAALAQLG